MGRHFHTSDLTRAAAAATTTQSTFALTTTTMMKQKTGQNGQRVTPFTFQANLFWSIRMMGL